MCVSTKAFCMTILSQELSRVAALTDEVLLNECSVLAARTRSTQAKLILLLSEVDERRLYVRHGFSSLHAFVVGQLRCSEGHSYRMIRAARSARLYPSLYQHIVSGELTLTGISLITPLLTGDTADMVIAEAVGKSTREIEVLVAKMSGAPAQRVREQVKIFGVPKVVQASPPLFQVSLPVDNSDIDVDVKNAKKDEPQEVTYQVTLFVDAEGYNYLQMLHATKSEKSASKIVTSLMKQEVEKGQKRVPKEKTSAAPPEKVEKAQSRVIRALVKRAVWARVRGNVALLAKAAGGVLVVLRFRCIMSFRLQKGAHTTLIIYSSFVRVIISTKLSTL